METTTFSSEQDAIIYWRNLAIEYKESSTNAHQELNEYQISSRELEEEYETQLQQADSKVKEFIRENSRLKFDLQQIRENYEVSEKNSVGLTNNLRDNLAEVSAFKDELQKYVQKLEQTNDNLERSKRSTVSSIEDFESRLCEAIERNIFLEGELEEHESLNITVQRLKDEARDLREELAIQKPSLKLLSATTAVSTSKPLQTSATCCPVCQIPSAPHSKPPVAVIVATRPIEMSPKTQIITQGSGRFLALSVISDLLKKVNDLERKLLSCKSIIEEPKLIMKSNVSASLKKVSTQVKRAPSCTTNASANKKYIQVL